MSVSLDAHAHLQDPCFDADRDEVLRQATAVGVRRWICNGTTPEDWPKVRDLASKHSEIVPCFGLHPWFANERFEELSEFLVDAKLPPGVGEIGLDFAVAPKNDPRQELVFRRQLDIARERRLPAMLHAVRSLERMIAVLRETGPFSLLLFHMFGGPAESVGTLLKLDAEVFFSFSVNLLNAKSSRVRKAALAVPLEKVLFESDAGSTRDGLRRTEPAVIREVVDEFAKIRCISRKELVEIVDENTTTFFRLWKNR